jgi:C1A family cysteine protease
LANPPGRGGAEIANNGISGIMDLEVAMKSAHGFLPAVALVLISLSASGQTTLPPSVDWRSHGAVSPVSNMGQCGADYAFVAAEALEGITAMRMGHLIVLSAQELVDCSTVDGNSGCRGGRVEGAFQWIKSHGLAAASDYRYTGRDGTCKQYAAPAARMTSYREVDMKVEALMEAVAQQPVAALIDAGSDFKTYSGGLYPCHANGLGNHWVLIVGYGTDAANRPYWLMKNSMGTAWGEHGYIRIPRTKECPNIHKAFVPVL